MPVVAHLPVEAFPSPVLVVEQREDGIVDGSGVDVQLWVIAPGGSLQIVGRGAGLGLQRRRAGDVAEPVPALTSPVAVFGAAFSSRQRTRMSE